MTGVQTCALPISFLKNQTEFLENKKEKVKDMEVALMEKELKNMQKSPRIDTRSALMCTMKPRTEILYKSFSKVKVKEEKIPVKSSKKSKSKKRFLKANRISEKRLKTVREEHQILEHQKREELNSIKRKVRENFYVHKKYENELDELLRAYNLQDSLISYNKFCSCNNNYIGDLLKDFGMIRTINEEKLAKTLYTSINKEGKDGISKNKMKSALFDILRINSQYSSDKKSKIYNQFQQFYLNKMLFTSRGNTDPRYTFRPTLNEKSIKLAERSREKRKYCLNDSSKKKDKTLTMLKLLTLAKQQIRSNSQRKNNKSLNTSLGRDVCLSLYNKSKKNRRRYDKSTEEIEYEKFKNELTFTPTIHR